MAPAATTKPPLRKETEPSGYGEVILRNGRILLGVVAVIVLSQVWNVSLEAMASRGLGTRIAESLFDIVITLILASAGWGILKTAINRQLPHETLDALAMAAGEVLGTGLSRLETLLPLLRKFVVVAMIVISSLGINIGPLLAGAGVVGIAVGFGAQTLVRDTSPAFFFSSTTPSASANTSMSARVRGPSSACRSGR
jgi:moderate conductance mechanosensitive channel